MKNKIKKVIEYLLGGKLNNVECSKNNTPIQINENIYHGKTIVIDENGVRIDGELLEENSTRPIIIYGNVDMVDAEYVHIDGDVHGDVDARVVECQGDISGDVSSINVNIKCRAIHGNLDTEKLK